MTRRFSPSSTERMPIWRISSGRIAGASPPRWVSSRGPEAAQAGHRHAVDVARGRDLAGVEIGVRIEPQHAQLLAGLAAMARDRGDRAHAQAMVAAEQDRHAARAQFGAAPRPSPRGSRRRLPADGDSRRSAAARDCADRRGCRDRHIDAARDQRLGQAGDAQRFRTEPRAAVRRRRCRWERRSGKRADKLRLMRRESCAGAGSQNRTDDLPLTRRLLYQLSYAGVEIAAA